MQAVNFAVDCNDMEKQPKFLFKKSNYVLMAIGLGLVILGFILMIENGSTDPNTFNDKVYSFRVITLAPILIIAGFIVEFFAIFKK